MQNSKTDEENQVDGELPEVDGLLEKLKNVLFSGYLPVNEYKAGVILMSTMEIWNMLQRLYPNELAYSPAMVSIWLHEKGYTFYDCGQLRYEWMLMPALK